MAIQQVSEHVYVETTHLGSNNSLIVSHDETVLIDAPHKPTDAIRWSETVSNYGDAKFLLNTDHHPDHTIGNSFLDGLIVAYEGTRRSLIHSPWTREYLTNLYSIIDPDAMSLDDRIFAPRLPSVTFRTGMSLHVGEVSLHIQHAPGHTPNSTLTFLPEDKVLFSGDNVCECGLPSFRQSSVRGWFEAIALADSYDFDVLVPGHGEVTDRSTIEWYRAQGRDLMRTVLEEMDRGTAREQIIETVRFEDRNHVSTEHYVGYPDDLIEGFQRSSIATIYDDLTSDASLRKLLLD